MTKTTWIKRTIPSHKQSVWSILSDPVPDASIVRDRIADNDTSYPYALHVNGQYHGHYRNLATAKKDAIVYLSK